MDNERLTFELGEKPLLKIYVNNEISFVCGEVKGSVTLYRPDINCAITIEHMSDEEWEEINMEDDDEKKESN